MLALELLLAMVLLVVCGFPAGFFLTRNLRWSPMEKLCGSIGASYGLLYLAFGTIYQLHNSNRSNVLAAVPNVARSCAAITLSIIASIAGLQIPGTLALPVDLAPAHDQ